MESERGSQGLRHGDLTLVPKFRWAFRHWWVHHYRVGLFLPCSHVYDRPASAEPTPAPTQLSSGVSDGGFGDAGWGLARQSRCRVRVSESATTDLVRPLVRERQPIHNHQRASHQHVSRPAFPCLSTVFSTYFCTVPALSGIQGSSAEARLASL